MLTNDNKQFVIAACCVVGMLVVVSCLCHKTMPTPPVKSYDAQITELRTDITSLATMIKYQQSEIKMLKRKIERKGK